jgi:hypothetical protein
MVGSQSDRFWVGSTMSTREQLEPDRLLPPYDRTSRLLHRAYRFLGCGGRRLGPVVGDISEQ